MAIYKMLKYHDGTAQANKIAVKALTNDDGTNEITTDEIGDLSNLKTSEKGSLVGSINSHLNDDTQHIYVDKNSPTTSYKLVVVDGRPYLEVVSV